MKMVLEMSEMSKTYQYRKVMKPMLERKRRARINKCLDALKDYMVEYLTQAGEHIARLEKADILELTVEHMKKLRDKKELNLTGAAAAAQDQKLIAESFRAGYVHAANEVSKTLAAFPGVSVDLGTQLMSHLGHRLNYLQVVVPTISAATTTTTTLQQKPQISAPQMLSPNGGMMSSSYLSASSSDCIVAAAITPPPSECGSSDSSSGSCSPAPSESSNSMWRPW